MLTQAAESSYRNGRQALEEGRRREALAHFEAALELERRLGEGGPQPRYLSYYGLCLGLVNHGYHEGVKFCQQAVELEQFDPDLRHNLGRIYLSAKLRKKARESLLAGLRMQPDHLGIRMELSRMGMRKRPVVPFLSRKHPLNVYLGRKRRGRGSPGNKHEAQRRKRYA